MEQTPPAQAGMRKEEEKKHDNNLVKLVPVLKSSSRLYCSVMKLVPKYILQMFLSIS